MKDVSSCLKGSPTKLQSTSTPLERTSGAALIASLSKTKRKKFLSGLSKQELRALPYLFDFWALPHQLPPKGSWRTWVILGGRGAGKTRAGAEWVRSEVEGALPTDPGRSKRIALIAETYDQARDVMVFGDSGILACTPADRKPKWIATRRQLEWPNGAQAELYSSSDFEGIRGPQFDAAWADEIGCAAIDKGSNQPNKFLDAKSSESALPNFSNGARDDLVQMQYIRAISEYWADPVNNPDATLYSGQMVDTDRQFAWAWDARPFPHFPGNQTLWSDGANYARGHWLSGRMSARSLASVITEICTQNGVSDIDVSEIYGFVRGYLQTGDASARQALQPLMLAASIDVVEKFGTLVFSNRSTSADIVLSDGDLAELEGGAITSQSREPLIEVPDRVRLNFLEADGDYEIRAKESVFPDASVDGLSQTELPLVLTQSEGQAATERWLSEVRVGRDTATFAVPPSVDISAGDVVELETESLAVLFRIDRIEEFGLRKAEAVRIEPGIYERAPAVEVVVPVRPVAAPVPVWPVVMDMPLLRGDEDPEAPWVAATAVPWPGEVAVYGSTLGASWGYEVTLSSRATMGESLSELNAAEAGTWDRGTPLDVRLTSGALSSISDQALLSGGNVALIGHPSIADWEVFQYRDAILVDQDTWALSMRLRGQRGTDGIIPTTWPIGSTVVIVDEAPRQIPIAPSQRGVAREYRIGPAAKPVDHSAYQTLSHVAHGIGLRPYRPVHFDARRLGGSDVRIAWVRQARIDGEFWDALDVPLGEAAESYQLRVIVSGAVRREVIVGASEWIYTAAEQLADSISGAFSIEVAQISDRFGPGLAGKVNVDV